MLTKTQAAIMLDLQKQMNAKVNPNWLVAGYPYLRAVVVEGAEAMEHHGWKWWKKQEIDLPQLQMELVDIWHFMLSHVLILANGNIDAATESIMRQMSVENYDVCINDKSFNIANADILGKLEWLIALAAIRELDVGVFAALLSDCKMSWDELYRQYVAKNVLNIFRQDHGYKEGTYRKLWASREDNEHLVEIMAVLDITSPDFRDQIYRGLKERYAATA